MNDIRGKRLGFFLVIALLAVAAFALPAVATQDTGEGHQVTICHVTESAGNPFVVVTVDVAAFDGEGANDHSHHVAKDRRVDKLWDAVHGCDEDGGSGG